MFGVIVAPSVKAVIVPRCATEKDWFVSVRATKLPTVSVGSPLTPSPLVTVMTFVVPIIVLAAAVELLVLATKPLVLNPEMACNSAS